MKKHEPVIWPFVVISIILALWGLAEAMKFAPRPLQDIPGWGF
jgi:hypothetical protein